MRYVLYPANAVGQAWLNRAINATAQAAAKPEEERKDYIESRNAVWSALKGTLEGLSSGKCWYTEARDKVSYWHVDHYRPKSLYYWLAFSWENFRLIGAIPNVRKSDDFPLEPGSERGTIATGVANERPMLLDPTRWGDPDLLTFKADGEPVCATPGVQLAVDRVAITVKLLGLDSENLCGHRRRKWRNCQKKLKKLQSLLEANSQQANFEGSELVDEICCAIGDLYDESAEFTSTAMSCAQELNALKLVELACRRARQVNGPDPV